MNKGQYSNPQNPHPTAENQRPNKPATEIRIGTIGPIGTPRRTPGSSGCVPASTGTATITAAP